MAGGDGTAFEKQVLEAAERLTGIAELTPLQQNPRLSADSGATVWLKREDLQVGRSYKLRGAYNLISQLDDEARAAGVVCASAGTHRFHADSPSWLNMFITGLMVTARVRTTVLACACSTA